MRYSSGAAFRRALEGRLRNRSLETGIPLLRLRKMVAFDRFLARLVRDPAQAWVLKGGLVMQLRVGDRARTTKDIDLLAVALDQDLRSVLQGAGALDLGDWFEFEIGDGSALIPAGFGGTRFRVRALLDGRTFERFHVDIGVGDPLVVPVEHLEIPALLDFAGVPPTTVPCYPVVQQIAEKVHAYTGVHASGQSSRAKDLVDILLMAELGEIKARDLYLALQATFEARRDQRLPASIPDPPRAWERPYRNLASDVDLAFGTLDAACEALQRFLNPVLSGQVTGSWDPGRWSWA